jgi:hypothetical protein
MEDDFGERRGYAPARFPGPAGYVVGDHRTSERLLRDWRATISDPFRRHYW